MKVSRRGLYALKALVHLAEAYDHGLVPAHSIASEEDIPEKFLEAILLALKNARLVTRPSAAATAATGCAARPRRSSSATSSG